MNKRGNEILVWLFVFVVGSLIVSFIMSPETFSTVTSNVKSLFSDVKLNTQASQAQDPSIQSCLNEIKEKSRIAKEKSIFSLNIDVREYEQFGDTISAIDYLREWGFASDNVYHFYPYNSYPELFSGEIFDLSKPESKNYVIPHGDLVVVLTRFDATLGGNTVGALHPIICIDGKIIESSKREFRNP